MKYFSASLDRSRSSYAFRWYSGGNAGFSDRGIRHAEIGVGERKVRVEFDSTFEKTESLRRTLSVVIALIPELKAFRASSDGVVACSRGVSNFCTVLSDSPSLLRMSDGHFSQSVEHMVLVARLGLRARE